MKKFIQSLELRRSDLFILLGLVAYVTFLLFGQLFMQYPNPNDVALPLWAAIIAFVLMVGFWGYYLYLEVYKNKEQYNLYLIGAFLFLMLLNVIVILVQPKLVVENVIVRYSETNPDLVGQTVTATIPVSATHKFVFISELIGAIMLIYIGLFVFPKRFKSIAFIKYLGYVLFAFLGVLILYGYIFEFKNYVGFFKYLLGIERIEGQSIYYFTIQSFILHRNAYGMMMMVGIIFAIINHSIDKKWQYYLLMAFFYVNMIFSLCKTGLLISALIIVIYIVYRLIATYKEHTKRNKIILITGASVIVLAGLVLGTSYITEGKVFGKIYEAIKSISGGGSTLDSRLYIWDNSFQLIRNGWWLIGRGFGTYNLMLMPMNILTHEDPVFPAHSAYVGLLAEGGILYLLAYICLLGYVVYVTIKCFKKNPGLTVAMGLGILSFVLYSFIEAIQYFVYVLIFPMMVLYQTSKEKKTEE